MKRLLFLGTTTKSSLAIAEILDTFLSTSIVSNGDYAITCIGFSETINYNNDASSIINIELDDPFVGLKHFGIRIKRKIDTSLNSNLGLSSSNYIYKQVLKLLNNQSFDYVFGVSGIFAFMQAAYRFSQKRNFKFVPIYLDPYSLRPNTSRKICMKKLVIEERWIKSAYKILYDADGSIPPFKEYEVKMIPFFIPIPDPVKTLPRRENTIVYGGTFYKGLRESDGIIELASREDMKNFSFEIYSNMNSNGKAPKNMHVHKRIKRIQFEKELLSASAVIVVGNKTNLRYQPSKFLTDISLRRPIIGVDNCHEIKYLEKYPFFYRADDQNLPTKLLSITNEQLLSFSPYSIYPERKPDAIVLAIIKQLRDSN